TSNGGLIVTASPSAFVHRDLIVALANRHKLPAVYPAPEFVTAGGLIAYGPDALDQFRRAAGAASSCRFSRSTNRRRPCLRSTRPKQQGRRRSTSLRLH